ncbi:MAG: TlpA disulfide reductase family protein [Verrucomicrobiota bacterium]
MKTTSLRNCVGLAFLLTLVGMTVLGGDPQARSSVSVGQKAPAFQAKTVDGKTINFPDDYKGKVVMLDFWATWCPPCRAELPNVAATYNQLHDKGFEIVSVSLDQPMQGPALLQFVKDHNMTWPQIYDGQYWKAAIAVKYGVRAIPCPVLVDGDTGTIIATDVGALGPNLATAVKSALAAKAAK